MIGLKEYLTEGELTIDASDLEIGHNEPREDKDFEELAGYGDKVFDVYVKNFGKKAPSSPWSKGMRQGPLERNLHKIVDTNRLDVHSFAFIHVYVFVRLKGKKGSKAVDEAKDMYNSKMRTLGQ